MTDNPYAETARLLKVARIIAALYVNKVPIESIQDQHNSKWWAIVAKAAGTNKPSKDTIAAVIDILSQFGAPITKCATCKSTRMVPNRAPLRNMVPCPDCRVGSDR